ncbi:MAG TPA: hypothetical protein VF129_01815 [Actinomycetota bacterium]
MTPVEAPGRDERGLVGKIIVLWLVLVLVVILGAIDAGSIVLTRVRTSDLAGDAASAAAAAYRDTGVRDDALRAALASVANRDRDARIDRFDVTRRGRVTLVVKTRAGTLLVGRFGVLDDLRTVTVTETAR